MARMKLLVKLGVVAVALVAPMVVRAQVEAPCPKDAVMDHGKSVAGKPLASPAMTAETMLVGKAISIRYNAPSMRCRKVMGELVPFGQVWRTGANPATTLVTAADLEIGALKIPAGTYTLYTLPAAPGTPWMLLVNKQTGQWGTVYNVDQDLGRTAMKSATLPQAQEVMSLTFEHVHGKKAELHVRWETTDEWVEVEAK